MDVEREVLEVDVLIVGGGPAGLACALYLKTLLKQKAPGEEVSVALIDKGGAVGNHSLSGAVMDQRGIRELLPACGEDGYPVEAVVEHDGFWYLTKTGSFRSPVTPPMLRNHGYEIVSLSRLTAWLAEKVEAAGVDLFPGFAGREVLYDDSNRVIGIRTGDQGLDKDGIPKGNFSPGVDIHARVTVLAEGVRGSLTKELVRRLRLDTGRNPQIYGTGVKEIWEVPADRVPKGFVAHTLGFPLDSRMYGGSWLYGMGGGQVSLGFAVGLDYDNPFTDPHRMLQDLKGHPFFREKLQGGTLVRYGAKAIPEGGWFSLPRPYADGVLLAGDCGGYLNAQRLKGIHLAFKTGMLAAETAHEALLRNDSGSAVLSGYERRIRDSWIHPELWKVRNFRQGFRHGLFAGMAQTGFQIVSGGRGLVAKLETRPDHTHMRTLQELRQAGKPDAPPPAVTDDEAALRFSKLTSVYNSGTAHEEDQPCHLHVADPEICRTRCAEEYGNPCVQFCPASVYEMVDDEERGGKRLQVNFTNCVHCKTCDVMDPYEIITWTPPQGGEGPVYTGM